MSRNRIRKIMLLVGLILLAISLAALTYALWPNPIQLDHIMLEPTLLSPPEGLP